MADSKLFLDAVGDVVLLAVTPGTPIEHEWNALFDRIDALPANKLIGAALGDFSLSASMRTRAAATFKQKRMKVTGLTESKVTRGLATAMSWLGVANIKAFAPDDYAGVFDFLGVPEAARAEIEARSRALLLEATTTRPS